MNHGLNILFFILWITNQATTQTCHERKSRSEPGTELYCSGFFSLLRLENVPQRSTVNQLSFSKNNITMIDSLSFNTDLSSVEHLYLDNNDIISITANTFKNLPNLNEIDLSYNKIEILDLETFKPNKQLKTIDLSGNKIRILDVNLVNTLDNLQKFILSNNALEFCHPRTVETLNYLDQNRIETHSVKRCEKQEVSTKAETVKTVKTEEVKTDNNTAIENYVVLVLVLCLILLFTICIAVVITIFCLKICKKLDSHNEGRKRTITETTFLPGERRFSHSSGEDENGYLIASVPVYQPKYLEVLDDRCQPLISLGSEENLNQPVASISTSVEIPIPHAPPRAPEDQSGTYKSNHVYEEIQECSFYTRNLQDHFLQPYKCLRKVTNNSKTC